MYTRRFCHLILLGVYASHVFSSSIISLSKDVIVHKGDTVQMKWKIRTDLQDSSKQVTCCLIVDQQNTPDMIRGIAQGDGTFKFSVTQEGENTFGQRMSVIQIQDNVEYLETTFAIVIRHVEAWDEHTYKCTYAEHEDTTILQVATHLAIPHPGFPPTIDVFVNQTKDVKVTLCSRPKPKVTWVYAKRTYTSHGTPTNNTHCFVHTYSVLVHSQRECGQRIRYTVTAYNRTVTGHIRIKIGFHAERPSDVKMKALQSPNCKEISWLGPNIGSCAALISYEIAIEWNSTAVDRYKTSSTLLHVCSQKFTIMTPITRVRSIIFNATSKWRRANKDEKQKKSYYVTKNTNNHSKIALIICTVIIVCLAFSLIPFVYNCYKNKRIVQSQKIETSDVGTRIRYTSLEINDIGRPSEEADRELDVFEENHESSKTDGTNTNIYPIQTVEEEQPCEENETNTDINRRHLSNNTDNYGYVEVSSDTADNQNVYSTVPRSNIKQGYTRSVSESNHHPYDELQRQKLKQSVSLDHYDAIRITTPERTVLEIPNKTRHSSDQTSNNTYQSHPSVKHKPPSLELSKTSTASASDLQEEDEIIYAVPKTPVKLDDKTKQRFAERHYENI